MVCAFDRSLEKQNQCLPGSHLPIHAPERISQIKPDYLVILPWNLSKEIMADHNYIRDWGGKFVIAVPQTRIID